MTDAGSVVRSCLDALEAGDSAAALALLDPEVEWRNSGLPTLRGRRAHRALLDMAKRGIGFEVRFHHLAVDGPVVLTDRTDVLTYRRFRMEFWVCGTFEVHGGRITSWWDRFDMVDTTWAVLRGVVRAPFSRRG